MLAVLTCSGVNLFKKHLFISNLSISFTLSGLGDIIQQNIKQSKTKWNPKQTLQMSASFGLTSGFLCHHWYDIFFMIYEYSASIL